MMFFPLGAIDLSLVCDYGFFVSIISLAENEEGDCLHIYFNAYVLLFIAVSMFVSAMVALPLGALGWSLIYDHGISCPHYTRFKGMKYKYLK